MPGDVRVAAIWAIRHGYPHEQLFQVLSAMERGDLVVAGEVSPKRRWSDVIINLHAAGIDVAGLDEARAS